MQNPAADSDTELKRRPRFSQELRNLSERFAGRPAPIAEILEATQGRGFNLLLVLLGG